ncbi:MAG: iron-containing alcohol dehydrogenase [Chloroflexota bacterium]
MSGSPIGGTTAFTLGRLPRITFGAGVIAQAPEIVARHGRTALIVTGQGSFARSGRLAALESGLAAVGVTVVGPVGVPAEPGPDDIDVAVAAHAGAGIDVVIGAGGGSAIDSAKAIAGLLRTGTTVRAHLEGFPDQQPYRGPAVPVVAIPTTAGTGAEATRNAVISRRGADGFKRSFRDEQLVPADAVVDPDLLAGLPPSAIAWNGLDALTQLLESVVSVKATPVTDALALDGLAAIRDGLLAWHADPEGPGAPATRARTAYGALLSGICLANAGLGAVHGLAAPLGGLLPVPHGAACGAVLWQVTDATITALAEREPGSPALGRYATLGRVLADLPATASDADARAALVAALRHAVAVLGTPGLGAFGLDEAGIPAVVAGARGSSMRTHPITLSDAELTAILGAAL